jgi:hypothetical protein
MRTQNKERFPHISEDDAVIEERKDLIETAMISKGLMITIEERMQLTLDM